MSDVEDDIYYDAISTGAKANEKKREQKKDAIDRPVAPSENTGLEDNTRDSFTNDANDATEIPTFDGLSYPQLNTSAIPKKKNSSNGRTAERKKMKQLSEDVQYEGKRQVAKNKSQALKRPSKKDKKGNPFTQHYHFDDPHKGAVPEAENEAMDHFNPFTMDSDDSGSDSSCFTDSTFDSYSNSDDDMETFSPDKPLSPKPKRDHQLKDLAHKVLPGHPKKESDEGHPVIEKVRFNRHRAPIALPASSGNINQNQDYKEPILAHVKKEELKVTFMTVEEIASKHKLFQIEFSEKLKKWNTDKKIGSIFYVKKQMESADRLPELMLKPLQRFPQIIMIIKDLFEYSPRDHHDRAQLQEAVTWIENVTHQLNERKRQSEQYFHGQQIVNKLSARMHPDKNIYLIRQDDMEQLLENKMNDAAHRSAGGEFIECSNIRNPAPLLSKSQLPTETVHVMSENDKYHFCQRSPDTEDTPLQSLEEIANPIYSKVDSIVMSNTAKDSDDVLDMEAQKHYKINTEDTPVDDQKEDKEPKWKDCIQKMLDDNILPGPKELKLAVKTFTYGNEIVKDICHRIEIRLQDEHEEIEYIKGCFKHDDPNKDVIFVIKASKPTTITSPYPLYVVEQNNIETMIEMECENCTEFQSEEMFQKACECLRIKSPDFMEAHSNLTSTSVSPVKLRKLQTLEKAVCIVFYVEAKGYIPIGEDVLPELIKYDENLEFVTDVREGECAIASAGPCDKHEDLKMGCRIVSSKIDAGGTLGCFVNHPTNGLCAITCSHVLLTVKDFGKLYKRKKEKQNVESLCTVKCYQPKKPDLCGEICDIKLFGTNINNCGMDIVLFKVDEERKPKSTAFPDIVAPGVDGVNPTLINDLLSKQMRYDPRSVMQDSEELLKRRFSQVVKYGMKSKLTSGRYHSSGGSATFQNKPKKIKYFLADQIVIKDDCGKFSEEGDSGAMVFVIDENKALMALGILTARDDKAKKTYVTPIWNILEEIEMPLPYVLAEPRKARVIIEELKSSIINNCEALHSILDQ